MPWLPGCLEWQPDRNEENSSRHSRLRHRFCNTTLLQDPAKVAIKRIYDLTPEQNSPVIGAQSIVNDKEERYKAAPERENQYHHGLKLDGSIYTRSRFQYGIDPSGSLFIADMPAFSTLPFILNGKHMQLRGFEHERREG